MNFDTYSFKYRSLFDINFFFRSVASDRPTTWSQFFVDLHLLSVLYPAGLSSVLLRPSAASTHGASDGSDHVEEKEGSINTTVKLFFGFHPLF